MRKLLDEKLDRFEVLEKEMVDPDVLGDADRMASVAGEYGSLAKLCGKYRRFLRLNGEIKEAEEMIAGSDPEMKVLAEAEIPDLKKEREGIWNELLDMTIGGSDSNRTSCIVEIRAGTGGDDVEFHACAEKS